jgi:hypothetical protein
MIRYRSRVHSIAVISIVVTFHVADCSCAANRVDADMPQLCGVRCVTTVLRRFGSPTPYLSVLSRFPGRCTVGDGGCSLDDVRRVLESYGLHCRAVRVGCNVTIAPGWTAIAHFVDAAGNGHFATAMPSKSSRHTHVYQWSPGVSKLMSDQTAASLRSGCILLVAQATIDDPRKALVVCYDWRQCIFWMVVLFLWFCSVPHCFGRVCHALLGSLMSRSFFCVGSSCSVKFLLIERNRLTVTTAASECARRG